MELDRKRIKIGRCSEKHFSMNESKTFTYQARIKPSCSKALDEYARLYSTVERKLFACLMAKKEDLNTLKSSFIRKYQITARQFNSIHSILKGKIASRKSIQKEQSQAIELKIAALKKRKKLRFNTFRRIALLQRKGKKLQSLQDKDVVSLCFGSKKLFRSQFEDKDLHEWKQQWLSSRSSSFFCIGSKDETAGNQSCTMTQGPKGLSCRLRLPYALSGYGTHTTLEGISFSYGQKEILDALNENQIRKTLKSQKDPGYRLCGQAIHYRFLKDAKGWRLFVTVSKHQTKQISQKSLGSIGVDINVNHLAVTETDRFGNPISSKKIRLSLYGKSKEQAQALIGDAVKEIVQLAVQKKKPVVLEKLDFKKKKLFLRSIAPKTARMLSSFSYTKIIEALKAKAFRSQIEVMQVDPAYTSMIGEIKFAKRYGLSKHFAAALVIGRRSYCFSEQLFAKASLLSRYQFFEWKVPVRNPSTRRGLYLKQVYQKYKMAHVEQARAEKSDPLQKEMYFEPCKRNFCT